MFKVNDSTDYDDVYCDKCKKLIEGTVVQHEYNQSTYCTDCAPEAMARVIEEIRDSATDAGIGDELEELI